MRPSSSKPLRLLVIRSTFFLKFLPFLGSVGDSVVVLAFRGLEGAGGASVTVISCRGERNWG